MRLKSLVLVVAFLALASSPTAARIIRVPTDSSTIQKGINGAVDGDTVLVAKGPPYYERITFDRKAILLTSQILFDTDTSNILDSTVIDGDTTGLGLTATDSLSVVRFVNGEGAGSMIQGFTIRNGLGIRSAIGGRKGVAFSVISLHRPSKAMSY